MRTASGWQALQDAITQLTKLLEGERTALVPPPALARLAAKFHLTTFECDLLLLCAAVELDSGIASRVTPTYELAFDLLADPSWSAASPSGPLRRFQLIEVAGESPLRSPLRIDERVLDYLVAPPGRDQRLSAFVEPCVTSALLCDSHREVAERISDALRAEPGTIVLVGDDAIANRFVAAEASSSIGLELYVLRADLGALSALDRERLSCLWEREAALLGAALLVEVLCTEPEAARSAQVLAEQLPAPLFVAVRDPILMRRPVTCTFEVGRPTPEEQRQLWQTAVPALADPGSAHSLDHVVSQFQFGAGAIDAIAREVRGVANPAPVVWHACRARGRKQLADLADRIEARARWNDLVLPEEPLRRLSEIAIHLRHRTTVYETWGFASQTDRGLGISALFSGTSGTGKTMAAEVLAAALDVDLFRIDLSRVVSKYIGETEKNLQRIFDAANESGAILLFDEADALFGKRTEVRDSHDRHANIEVSYLLSRMESYRGLAILTTNMREAIDTAFLRRLRFIIEFPFPSEHQRRDIWQRVWPRQVRAENLDASKLARLQLTGGNIRNIALHAAFLAAEARGTVSMTHILSAAQAEFGKMKKPFDHAQVADWV